jgi:hypothetical protein
MVEQVLMTFGKHKGLPLDYIAKEYPAYHRWAIKIMFFHYVLSKQSR